MFKKRKRIYSKKRLTLVFISIVIIFKALNVFFSLLKLEPLQFGLFFSKKMKIFIGNNASEYDFLFFHTIRSSQYLPKTSVVKL